jgi:uncharacterized protein DUF4154
MRNASARSLLFALAWLVAAGCADTARSQALEVAVKATFLHKFVAFIEWPESVFEASGSPFVLCVAGNDPVGKLVGQAAAGQAYATHPIEVRPVAQPSAVAACHMLYVAGLPAETIEAYLQAARAKPILTVTDSAASRRTQGMINFVVRDNRVRFEIDLDLAASHRVVVSSKLASLAVTSRGVP